MANIFAERENVCLRGPAVKMRQRLQSAPGYNATALKSIPPSAAEKLLKSPMIAKTFNTPLLSGRKAFGAVNKKISTPAISAQEKRLAKPQEAKVKPAPQSRAEEYPEMEKFIPYDPSEFEKYSVPEDLVPLGSLALPGLAYFPPAPLGCEEDLEMFAALPDVSPAKMPQRSDDSSVLDAFLQTLDELTVELPPEPLTH